MFISGYERRIVSIVYAKETRVWSIFASRELVAAVFTDDVGLDRRAGD